MNDLQDKLDQHGPPDFGRAALWNRIERPRRRRRGLFFWWALGAAVLMLGACLWNSHWFSDKNANASSPTLPEKTEATPTLPDNPEGAARKGKADKIPPTNSAQLERPATATPVSTLPADAASSDGSAGRQGHISAADDPSGESQMMQQLNTSSGNHTISNASALPLPSLSTLAPLQKLPVSPLPVSLAEEGASAAGLGPMRSLSSLPPAPLSPPVDTSRWNLDATGAEGLSDSAPSRNAFAITLGIASQWRLLDETHCARRREEPALPGYFLGARYQRKLSKGYYLLSSLTYTYHQSRITDSAVEFEQFYDELAGKSILRTTTFYELYNQYHRLDFAIGAGRSWQLRKFDLALEGSLGAAHWLQIDGDYLDDAAGLQPLPEAAPASLFGRLSGELSRALPNGFRLGLNISGQTPIRVDPKGEGCGYRLLPIYLGVSMGRQF